MKIIEPKAELFDFVDTEATMKKLEACGRVSHQSQAREGSADNFVRMLIKRGHESVLEHVSLTFHIVCDRGVSHELVRHRFASPTQESTRYVKYKELEFIAPFELDEDNPAHCAWLRTIRACEHGYIDMLSNGMTPEQARSVLPNCVKTELYVTANLRSWRWILKLRTSKAAHPQMRQLMNQVLTILRDKLPVIVEDIGNE